MFDTIVWATDGSQSADRALEVAKTLAHDQEASLVVVHVAQHYATKTGLAVYPDEDVVKAKLERDRPAALERWVQTDSQDR